MVFASYWWDVLRINYSKKQKAKRRAFELYNSRTNFFLGFELISFSVLSKTYTWSSRFKKYIYRQENHSRLAIPGTHLCLLFGLLLCVAKEVLRYVMVVVVVVVVVGDGGGVPFRQHMMQSRSRGGCNTYTTQRQGRSSGSGGQQLRQRAGK